MGIQFGNFTSLCETTALVICPLVETEFGVAPDCYSRNVDIGEFLLFQPSTFFVHIAALVMTTIMIVHIRSKYTAVGRKEILHFFYMYTCIEFAGLFLDSAIVPTASPAYPWFAAAYTGLVAATHCCILVNAFVGFQFAEDGTPLSLWTLRISCLLVFGAAFFVAIATFQQFAGFSYTRPLGLWVVYVLWPPICSLTYLVSQLILVFQTLEDHWPFVDIVFGAAFYGLGIATLVAFSNEICHTVVHYIDGVFFFHACMLLTVMMIYKYWDSITCEDLEFSVGNKASQWEVKDPLLLGGGEFDGESDIPLAFSTSGSQHGGYPPSPPSP